MRTAKAIVAGLLIAGMVGLASPRAVDALSVTSLTVTPNAGNFTTFSTTSSGFVVAAGTSATAITIAPGGAVADTVAATRTFSTRYSEILGADATLSSPTTGTRASDYRVQFTVNVGAGVAYTLQLDTRMFGQLTLVDDAGSTSTATAVISAVTGKLGGVTQTNLGLAVGKTQTSTTGVDHDILATNTLTPAAFTGTQSFTLDFTWSASASSNQDEAGVRLGINGTVAALDGTTAENYPGTPARNSTCATFLALGGCLAGGFADGHFVTVLATITSVPGNGVPAPASLLLIGAATIGAGGVAWRRRRA